ncbi:class I SAM-dependent methyltransferase [Niveispirillum fermenti]|uniref:class I SAM-dependent methyltransferase n=1 Tax=Niveispirillum fermenti TaxID=1233113 RepID=UPI003A892B5A
MSIAKAIHHPFATGLLPLPARGTGFILNAGADSALSPDLRPLICVTGFKPAHDALVQAGFQVVRDLPAGPYRTGLCLMTKHKAESLAAMAQAWEALEPGGLLVCCGDNDTGVASLMKAARQAFGEMENLSKHHARVFWTVKQAGPPPAILAEWQEGATVRRVEATGFMAGPGMHGWNKVDAGSRLLATQFPGAIRGRVADLGAGWGYLSAELLRAGPGRVAGLDLYEADAASLAAAATNVAPLAGGTVLKYHWADVTAGLPRGRFDWIITNPPFHAGKATDVTLGSQFIIRAAEALGTGGTLLLVANKHLPYEAVFDGHFKSRRTVAEAEGFKVIEGRK